MTKRVDVCYVGKQEVLSEGLFINDNKIEEIHIGGDSELHAMLKHRV